VATVKTLYKSIHSLSAFPSSPLPFLTLSFYFFLPPLSSPLSFSAFLLFPCFILPLLTRSIILTLSFYFLFSFPPLLFLLFQHSPCIAMFHSSSPDSLYNFNALLLFLFHYPLSSPLSFSAFLLLPCFILPLLTRSIILTLSFYSFSITPSPLSSPRSFGALLPLPCFILPRLTRSIIILTLSFYSFFITPSYLHSLSALSFYSCFILPLLTRSIILTLSFYSFFITHSPLPSLSALSFYFHVSFFLS
jgi:hypothetical protein